MDIDIEQKADADDIEDKKSKSKSRKKTDPKLKKRKDTPDDADSPDDGANDNEVDGYGDDDHKKENQGQYLPLEGGLAGLIGQLSGVREVINWKENFSQLFYRVYDFFYLMHDLGCRRLRYWRRCR